MKFGKPYSSTGFSYHCAVNCDGYCLHSIMAGLIKKPPFAEKG